jgi:proline iminopeptidase
MRIRVNGVELFVDVHGPALGRREEGIVEKPVLLALHGGPGLDHANLVPWLAPLTEQVQILYVDHRGNGRSGRPPLEECTLDAMADDLEAVRRLLGLGPLIVLGVSFGGMVGLTYALRHPAGVARLIGCVTAASGDFVDDARRLARERATPQQMEIVEHMLDGTFRDEAHFREGFAAVASLYEHRSDPARDAAALPSVLNVAMLNWFFSTEVKRYDLRTRLGEVRAPTLVLTGRHDWICAPAHSDTLVRGIPGARQVIFEESGHRVIKEENERFVRVVTEFIHESR